MNYIDLFSGIGGFHRGLEEAGFKFDWCGFSEVDKHAKSVYQKHFPRSEDLGDVTGINVSRLPKAKRWLVTGGWPCQDNSIAGKRKGQTGGTRSGLFDQIVKILHGLVELGAEVIFIGENVKGLYSVNGGVDFINTITRLADLDTGSPQFSVELQLCNTRWFLPQNRERVYFVGYSGKRGGQQVFPIGEGDENTPKSREQSKAGVFCNGLDSSYHKGPDGKRTMIQIGNVDTKGHNSIWGRVYSPEGDATTLNAKGGGMGAKTGLYEVKRHPLKFMERNQNTADIHYIPEQSGIRRLTPTECARLQGFPDNWCEGLSDSAQYRCFGNAVSVPVVRAIGEAVMSLEKLTEEHSKQLLR